MQRVGDREPMHGELGALYDAIENPRKVRNELPILRGDELRAYMDEVRARTLEVLESVDLDGHPDPADRRRLHLRDAARPRASAQRDHAAAAADGRRLRAALGRRDGRRRAGRRRPRDGHRVGRDATRSAPRPTGFAYDNERPRHRSSSTAFRDRPHAGHQRRLRRVRRRHRRRAADVLGARRRWLGRRPPSAAASRSTRARRSSTSTGIRPTPSRAGPASGCRPSSSGRRRRAGADPERANLDHLGFGCAPAGAYADGASDCRRGADARRRLGVDELRLHRLSRVQAFPYPEYSEVFFGDEYKVLRGGAWATRRDVIRHELSQLGPSPSAHRSSPAFVA